MRKSKLNGLVFIKICISLVNIEVEARREIPKWFPMPRGVLLSEMVTKFLRKVQNRKDFARFWLEIVWSQVNILPNISRGEGWKYMQILMLITIFFSIFTPKFANSLNVYPKNANLDNFFPKKCNFEKFPLLKVKNMGKFFHHPGRK